jgi:hypothetical protein
MEYKKIIRLKKRLLISLFCVFALLFQTLEIMSKTKKRDHQKTKYYRGMIRKGRFLKNDQKLKNTKSTRFNRKKKHIKRKKYQNNGVYKMEAIKEQIKADPNLAKEAIKHFKDGVINIADVPDKAAKYMKKIIEDQKEFVSKSEENQENYLQIQNGYLINCTYTDDVLKQHLTDFIKKNQENLFKIIILGSALKCMQPKIVTDKTVDQKAVEIINQNIKNIENILIKSKVNEGREVLINSGNQQNLFEQALSVFFSHMNPENFNKGGGWFSKKSLENDFMKIITTKQIYELLLAIEELDIKGEEPDKVAQKIQVLVLAFLSDPKTRILPNIFIGDNKLTPEIIDYISAASSNNDIYGRICKLYLESLFKLYGQNVKIKTTYIELKNRSTLLKGLLWTGGVAAIAAAYGASTAYRDSSFSLGGMKSVVGRDAEKIKEALTGGYNTVKHLFTKKSESSAPKA